MTMRGMHRWAPVLGLIAFTAASVEAATLTGAPPEAAAVRVINNYIAPVKVYVEDADGKLHKLGNVRRSHAEVFEITSEVTALGSYRIKVFPNDPAWGPVSDDFGIRTRDISLVEGQVLNFWVEPDLTRSRVELATG